MDLLITLFVALGLIIIFGHFSWVIIATIARWIFSASHHSNKIQTIKSSDPSLDQLIQLSVTEGQITKFYADGKLSHDIYQLLLKQIRAERTSLTTPVTTPARPALRSDSVEVFATVSTPSSVVSASLADELIESKPVPSFINSGEAETEPAFEEFTPPRRAPRRSFSEVLNSFMEESNIRWGEIVGGLLIIGCSTALVVSLWAQISQIPVVKFLIFTTVTAVLFGIGLYTEHRWKLPTTSRGILTIATLLVPLNFLAIAAVSASQTSGALVIGSELSAPAIFLCLVYFAGRVITPGYAHVLSAGVLGSSAGQLLVRHFASIDTPPWLQILLGAFPVTCYVVTVALALRPLLRDREINESKLTTVFTLLGTMSFAALLPLGLLLYKSGPLSLSMMYLAPLVTVWGLPLVATGTILWKRIANQELVAARTVGAALALLGLMIVIAGMMLAWPNPASIVPAALLSFATFTVLAVALELPLAHVIAAGCFALAYLVSFHVFAGNITWVNLRVLSLLRLTLSVSSGQALVGGFALFLVASEWLSQRDRERDSYYYFVSACSVALLSLALVTVFGEWSYPSLWVLYGLYSLSAFWIAWRRRLTAFTWIASGLLLLSLAHCFANSLSFSFPWQTALFTHATICAMGAIASARYGREKVFRIPLNVSALISIGLGIVSLFQANEWEVTWIQAQRVWWISGILGLLLWLNRRRLILSALQIAMISALVLSVKAALQHYEWYAYLPDAFLHPIALQIQGTVLALFCLAWLGLRFLLRRKSAASETTSRLFDSSYSIDRILGWVLAPLFLLLAVYGAFSGVTQELAGLGSGYPGFDVAGFPHRDALGLGSWIVLGLLSLTMLLSYRERRRAHYLLGAIATVSATIPLLAGQFETHIAAATAWRWLAALFLVTGSLVVWYRRDVSRVFRGSAWPAIDGNPERFATRTRTLLLTLTVVPLLLLTMLPALRAVYYLQEQGPSSGIFSGSADYFSYGGPLVLVALVMIGYALRERLPEFAFYGGLFVNATVTFAFLLTVFAMDGPMDRVTLVQLMQLNAITCALYALPWIATKRRWESALSSSDSRFSNFLFAFQMITAIGLNVALIFTIVLELVVLPDGAGIATNAAGSFTGGLALVITAGTAALLVKTRRRPLLAELLAGFLLAGACLTAFGVSDLSGWFGLHVLTVGTAATAWLMVIAGDLPAPRLINLDSRWQSKCRDLALIVGALALLLSLRTLSDDGASRWWSVGPLLAITALAATLNWKTLERTYLYAAGILFTLTVSVWWVFILERLFRPDEFLLINLIAGSLAGILWLGLELRSRQRANTTVSGVSFHSIVAVSSLALLTLFVIASFSYGPFDSPLLRLPFLSIAALLSIFALMAACLWDRRAKYAVVGLYILGVLAGAIALCLVQLRGTELAWASAILLAAYSLFVTLLWRRRNQLISLAARIGVPARLAPEATELRWLSAMTVLAVATACALTYWTSLNSSDAQLRFAPALMLTAQSLTFAGMAVGTCQQRWRRAALAALVIGSTLTGWSLLTPGINATWLNRSVIVMLLAFGLTALYGLLLKRANARFPEWTSAAKAFVPWLVGAGVLALLFCLQTEIFYQIEFGAVRINPLSLVAIGVALAAAVVTCVVFALSPGHDPLALSERGRMKYVYAAEVLLAALLLHLRLTLPWLFTGFIERYWPLAIMSIAYFGVVTSEALKRAKLIVLAQPLERTGIFLPLLPVLGFWLASSEVDFSLVLFIIGGLYGLLSILRRSFAFGVLAAVAGNAGLWYVFHRTEDYQFLQHPQLWLIPVALSALLAAYLSEDQLSEDQMTGARYLSLVTIYASSTADIIINGAANSPWLPLILGSLSLAGVFAGIMFRIRGLLLLGSIFLLLSIVTMIWYASENFGWTWLWYVAGIATGAAIIFMFALFEKKRSEVLRLVEGLKQWER